MNIWKCMESFINFIWSETKRLVWIMRSRMSFGRYIWSQLCHFIINLLIILINYIKNLIKFILIYGKWSINLPPPSKISIPSINLTAGLFSWINSQIIANKTYDYIYIYKRNYKCNNNNIIKNETNISITLSTLI